MQEIVVEDYAPNNKSKSRRPKWVSEVKKMIAEMELCKEPTPSRNAHYKAMKIEPLDVMEDWLTQEQLLGFLLGNVLKYTGRYNHTAQGKGGVHDLKKAQDYLKWAIASLPDESTES